MPALNEECMGIRAVEKEDVNLQTVEPDENRDNRSLHVIELIDELLSQSKNVLDNIIDDKPDPKINKIRKDPNIWERVRKSVARLQGGRYQIHVQDSKNPNGFFYDYILVAIQAQHSEENDTPYGEGFYAPDNLFNVLIQYAKDKARIMPSYPECMYDNFSFILTYEESNPQYRHVDVVHPNCSFLLSMSDESTLTLGYTVPFQICKPRDLLQVKGWHDIPSNVIEVMESDSWIMERFKKYGNVLNHYSLQIQHIPETDGRIKRGTVLGVKGRYLMRMYMFLCNAFVM